MFGHNDQDRKEDETINAEHLDDVARGDDTPATSPANVQPTTDAADPAGLSGFVATPAPRATDTAAAAPLATDDLLDIKHQALQELTPLVGQLDQTPEEQFRTTMMMIQASDNHALVKVAYEAAKKITNEKERAQALLDIVNEINYFTQHAA